MREDDNNPFRPAPNGGAQERQEHLWLRQSATFSVNGQTRTVEIALPVRPGASPDEVAALLDEADAGMRLLSRRLDAHVAALLGGSDAPPVQAMAAVAPIAIHTPTLPSAATPPSTAPTAAEAPAAEAPAAERATPRAPYQSPPPREPESPTSPDAPRPQPSRPLVAEPATLPTAPRQAPPQLPQQARPGVQAPPNAGAGAPTPPQATAPTIAVDGPELSRAEFLTAANALGLNPKQAMEKLNVRSLNGLNLREALGLLQRQSLRAEAPSAAPAQSAPATRAPAAATSSPAPTRAAPRPASPAPTPDTRRPAPSATPPAPPAPRPAYTFDEEEEPEMTFNLPDDPLDDEYGVPASAKATLATLPTTARPQTSGATGKEPDDGLPLDAYDDLDPLDDVDDLDDLDEPTGANAFTPPLATPGESADALAGDADDGLAVGRRIITRLRTARGGGVPAQQQRMAYRNIVIAQLGEQMASDLVRGVWRINPERLGPEQLDAINHWGKEDAFADEAPLVLAAIETERATQATAPVAPPASATTPPASAPASARPATPTRARAPRAAPEREG